MILEHLNLMRSKYLAKRDKITSTFEKSWGTYDLRQLTSHHFTRNELLSHKKRQSRSSVSSWAQVREKKDKTGHFTLEKVAIAMRPSDVVLVVPGFNYEARL